MRNPAAVQGASVGSLVVMDDEAGGHGPARTVGRLDLALCAADRAVAAHQFGRRAVGGGIRAPPRPYPDA